MEARRGEMRKERSVKIVLLLVVYIYIHIHRLYHAAISSRNSHPRDDGTELVVVAVVVVARRGKDGSRGAHLKKINFFLYVINIA